MHFLVYQIICRKNAKNVKKNPAKNTINDKGLKMPALI